MARNLCSLMRSGTLEHSISRIKMALLNLESVQFKVKSYKLNFLAADLLCAVKKAMYGILFAARDECSSPLALIIPLLIYHVFFILMRKFEVFLAQLVFYGT